MPSTPGNGVPGSSTGWRSRRRRPGPVGRHALRGMFRSADAVRTSNGRACSPAPSADVNFHPTDNAKARSQGGPHQRASSYFFNERRPNLEGRPRTRPALAQPRRADLRRRRTAPIVYASIQMSQVRSGARADGGRAYTRREERPGRRQGPAPYLGEQGWYDNVIWAGDPTDENLVIVGGIDLWRSTDGGDRCGTSARWWDPRSAHADHHCIVSDPATTERQQARSSSATTAASYRPTTSAPSATTQGPPSGAGRSWSTRSG